MHALPRQHKATATNDKQLNQPGYLFSVYPQADRTVTVIGLTKKNYFHSQID